MKKRLISILLLIGISLTNWTCGTVNDLLDGDSNPDKYAISSDKYDVNPFETVILTIDEYIFTEESYHGTIYDQEVILLKISDTQLTFMMPYIPEGDRVLEFILEDVKHDVEFTILKSEEIQYPEEVITSYSIKVLEAFNELKNMDQLYDLQIEPQNLQVIEKYISDFNNAYISSTIEEKQELAQFMNANPDIFDFSNFDYSFFNDSINTSKSFVHWDEQLTEDMHYFTGLVILTGATVALFNGALISLNPLAIFITGGALLTEAVLLKRQTKTILNRSYKPFEFDINNELKTGTVEFENDIEYQLGIDATFRTLYKNDQNSSDVTIELVANINTVTRYWNQVLENIPGTNGSVRNLNDQINYKVNSNRRIVNPKFISIGNISNSNVNLTGFDNSNIVKVKFTTTAEEDQDFTFDIVYTNPDFSVETITVSAKVVVTTFDYAGVWLLRWYNTSDGELFQDDRITFGANGTSTFGEYNIYPNNNGWATYQGETFSMSYSDGSLTIHDNYWGNTYHFTVNSVDDNIFIGTYPVSGWNQELHRQ